MAKKPTPSLTTVAALDEPPRSPMTVRRTIRRPELLRWCDKHNIEMDHTIGVNEIADRLDAMVASGKIKPKDLP